ncbi:MiaB/RimO family radical SAM methylthiotransferase [Candidatus Beckwithbacteria bacterium]|nr:MiaB/RimO family radical SAM methylthiotransferase [Candidatus Beckwithbacteria bacterium]
MPKTYFIQTWGCAMNEADAQRIAGVYESRGYILAKNADEADEIVLVTCSVRKSAEDRVLGLVHNLSQKYKNKKSRPKLILSGCMLHYGEEKLHEILPLVDEFLPISEVSFNTPSIRQSKTKALVPISTGCNSFCSYCVVPLARGREKSRPMKNIITEIEKLAQDGFSEIMLLGQNVNSYGLEKIGMSLRKRLDEDRKMPSPQSQYKAFKGKPPFVRLLEKICAIEGIKKVEFISSNPWDFHWQLIDCIAANPKISRTIHLALQSGDDEILAKMNRGYTAKQYLELVKTIRKKIPVVKITTDIIVGFPGETEEQFKHTVELCKKIGFNLAYINRYSPRPGTVSAKLYQDDVHDLEKKRRWEVLDKLINRK